MATAYGANAKVYLKAQTDAETPATGNYLQVPFISFGLTGAQALGQDNVLGMGAGRDVGDPYLDTITVDGSAVVPVDLVAFGHWLKLLLGLPTTTGTTDFTHVFTSGKATLPYYSIEKAYPEVPSFDRYLGVRAGTLSLDMSPSGPANATFGLMGLDETNSTTSGAGTPVATNGARLMRASSYIKKDGVSLGKVIGGSINFTNGMTPLRTIRADNRNEDIDLGSSAGNGEVRMRFADNVLKAQAMAGTPSVLTYGFAISATKSVEFEFARGFFSRPRNEISGPGGIDLTAQWMASSVATANPLLKVTLKNQVASYA